MTALLSALQANSGWLALVALLVAAAAVAWAAVLQKRLHTVTPDIRRLVRDMEGKDFDEVLRDLLGNMEFVGKRVGRLEVAAEELARRQSRAVQRVGLVRYNAEQGLGGELSFALALLNGERDGALLTCFHTLSECRVYLRNVEKGVCSHELTDEETAALEIALKRRRPDVGKTSRLRRARWRAKDHAENDRGETTGKRGTENAE